MLMPEFLLSYENNKLSILIFLWIIASIIWLIFNKKKSKKGYIEKIDFLVWFITLLIIGIILISVRFNENLKYGIASFILWLGALISGIINIKYKKILKDSESYNNGVLFILGALWIFITVLYIYIKKVLS